MKGLMLSIFIFLPIVLISQIQPDEELDVKLRGKQKFSEIKQTVLDHYNSKLSLLSTTDTVVKKKYMRQLKMWNRQLWISEFYTNVDGIVQNQHDINERGIYQMAKMKPKVSNRNQPYNWNLQGPTSSDKGIGRFDKIAFHPTDPNIIFAGSPHGGLFKTVDGGNNWNPISSFLPSLGISGIAIHPTNPDIIYVLTGDGNSPGGCFPGNVCLKLGEYRAASKGIYKSYNGGASWINLVDFSSDIYRGLDLIINPTNPEILIAATTIGIYRSTNGGQSWVQENNGAFFDLEFKPGDPNIVYASGTTQFLRSTDGGNNFFNTLFFVNTDRISIGVSSNDNTKVYLVGSNNNGTIFSISNDSGLNFNTTSIQHIIEGQSSFNHTIAVNPTNANDIYVGGLNVWHSSNGGTDWTQVSKYWPWETPYMHPDIHHLNFNAINNKLYCANDGGVYLFENNVWVSKFNGLTTSMFYHFEREDDNGKIWGGLQDNGIQVQENGGNYILDNTGDGYDQMTDHNYLVDDGDGDTYFFSFNSSIAKNCNSFPNGCDISVPGNTSFFANLAMSPNEENKIYAGYNTGLWRSTNAGDDWTNVSNQPANWCVSTTRHNDVVYFAGDNGLFRWVTGNAAVNRTPPSPYTPTLKITDIDVDRLNENNLYISIAGNEENVKVFCSNNGGINWSNLTFNLPDVPVFCIKLDANNGLYVGTSIGVFYKPAGVNHWQPFSNGLPPTPITEIELWPVPHPTNGNQPSNPPPSPEIWISTFGRGIWFTQQYTPYCENNLPLAGELRGVHYKESNLTITSTQEILGGEGSNVKYNTGNRITLTDGFRAWYGSTFKTYFTGCGGVVD